MLGRLIEEHARFQEERDMARRRSILLEGRLMSGLSLNELKELWDSYDGIETSDPVIDGEMVHAELNRRGHGRYCAV